MTAGGLLGLIVVVTVFFMALRLGA
jgi:hypothetical protein